MINVSRLAASLLLSGALVLGIARIAILPPWEGFDETAHYSYIQQLAETGQWPRFGDPVSRDIEDYLQAIPAVDYAPWKYPALFASSDDAIERARHVIKDAPAQERSWRRGDGGNWEAQHPPLYYALTAPLYLLSRSWGLAHQLFLLRSFSYLLAFAGLCLAAFASTRAAPPRRRQTAILSVALWPVVFPMWFPEMARLGNDCVVILLAACAMLMIRRVLTNDERSADYALLGLTIGAGLLTKATVLPFAAALGAIFLYRLYGARRDVAALMRRLKGLVILGAITALISGWWYLGKFFETGSVIGSNDLAHVAAQGAAPDTGGHLLAKLPWLFVQTFLWFGTWSSALPPRALVYPLAATSTVLAYGAARSIRRDGAGLTGCLALLTLAGFLAALTYLAVVTAAGTGGAAWYLHAFAPVLAPLLGFGIAGLQDTARGRVALGVCLYFPLTFLVIATAADAFTYAGCGARLPNSMYYDFAAMGRCAGHLDEVYRHLDVMAFPALFLPLFLVGWGLSLAGVIVALRSLHGSDQASITSTR